jgi:hypothetical protein
MERSFWGKMSKVGERWLGLQRKGGRRRGEGRGSNIPLTN